MYNKINFQKLNDLLSDPNFKVHEVYGPRPNSKEYKNKTGKWDVIGSFKS